MYPVNSTERQKELIRMDWDEIEKKALSGELQGEELELSMNYFLKTLYKCSLEENKK